jgi:hypothetical protein
MLATAPVDRRALSRARGTTQLQRHLHEAVDLYVVALGLEAVDDVGGRPGVRERRGRARQSRATAPSATAVSGVMTKSFISKLPA